MTTLSIQPPFPLLTDIDGQPLEDGYIWIGTANLPPIGNPIAVYWDAALTIPAALPVRTRGGYPVNAGTPARLYVGSDYSILVQNKNGSTLYSAPDGASDRFSAAQISFLQAGLGAVVRTAQSKMRDTVSVKDFGAVGDGVVSGNNVVSGTDNLAAFNAAFAEATANGITRVRAPGGFYYISAPFTLPRGVTLEGDGTSHLPIVTQSSNRTGTCLLINGTVGADCLAFEPNSGHSGLAEISIYNTNTNAIRSVVSVVGHLYPRMTNVELASLKKTTGCGLWISAATTGAKFSTLWGAFHNVMAAITDVGSPIEASVRYGLIVYGFTPVDVSNANSFVSGQFSGAWAGMLMDGDAGNTGALSCVFHGVKFDTNWDGTYIPEFRAAADGVFGWLEDDCYIYPVVHLKKGRDTAFHGCYFEAAGSPATYNDGVNGSHDLIAVFYNGGGTNVNLGTDVLGCNWNGCYLFDIGQAARVDPALTTRYSTRPVENLLVLASGTQSIPAYAWTKVELNGGPQFGDNSFLEWDATNDAAKIRSPGTYLITGQFEFAGWAVGAGTYGLIRIQTDAGYTYQGSRMGPLALNEPITIQAQVQMNLIRGQSVWLEVLQNQGSNQNSSGGNIRLNVTKIC